MKRIQVAVVAILFAGGLFATFAFTSKKADKPFTTTKLRFDPLKDYRFAGNPFTSIIASDLNVDANSDAAPDKYTDVTLPGFSGSGTTDKLEGISFNSSELTQMQAANGVNSYYVTNSQLPAHGQTVPVTVGANTYYVTIWTD